MTGRLVPVIKASKQDGNYVKAGENDRWIRSRGERHATLRGMAPGIGMSVGGLVAYSGGVATGNRKLSRTGIGTLAAGTVAEHVGGHRAANKWRRKQGIGERNYWSGKAREVGKASPSRTRKRRQERREGSAKPTAGPDPQLLAGQAQRDLRALEAAEAGHDHPAFKRPKTPVTAIPPPAAVNHATTPASAARGLASRRLKVGGGVAAGVGAATAGGVLLDRKLKQRKRALQGVTGKARNQR